ncbi:hypothetical protein ACX1N5_15295 [Acinetobacter sp. ANC 4636]
MEKIYTLSKDTGIAMNHVLDLPLSFDPDFYGSDAYRAVKAERKAENEKQQVFYKIMNEVIKGINRIIR